MRRNFLFSCLIMVLCLILAGSTWAEEKKPSGTIYIKSKSVAIGVGVTFKVDGVSVVDLGFSSVEMTGEVYNLKSASDFAGSYAAATAGAKFGDAGGSVTSLKNDKEVVLKLKAKGEGIRLTFAPSGVMIKMKE